MEVLDRPLIRWKAKRSLLTIGYVDRLHANGRAMLGMLHSILVLRTRQRIMTADLDLQVQGRSRPQLSQWSLQASQ